MLIVNELGAPNDEEVDWVDDFSRSVPAATDCIFGNCHRSIL